MRRIAVAALFVSSIVVGWAVGEQPTAVAAGPCEELQGASLAGGSLAESTPVVLVHGFTGSKTAWFAPIDQAIDDDVNVDLPSFVGQLLRIDAASVWLFDYQDTSARWVTDPTIGSALADLLQCFSDNGAQPAVIAAHSMGGLAARQAMSELADSAIVSGLVTFATPHTGSMMAEVVAQIEKDNSSSAGFLGPIKAAVKSSIQLCGQTKTINASYECGWLNVLPPVESDAGLAMIPGSRQLEELPPIPDHVQVLGLAGQIEIVVQESRWGFFYSDVERWRVGDLIVGADSATAMSDENRTFTCQLNFKKGYAISDDARQLFGINYDDGKERGISNLVSNPCYHSNLTKTVEITNQALGFIGDIARQQRPARLSDLGGEAFEDPFLDAGLFTMQPADDYFPGAMIAGLSYDGEPSGLDSLGMSPLDPSTEISGLREDQILVLAWFAYPSGDLIPSATVLYAYDDVEDAWLAELVFSDDDIEEAMQVFPSYETATKEAATVLSIEFDSIEVSQGLLRFRAELEALDYFRDYEQVFTSRIVCTVELGVVCALDL